MRYPTSSSPSAVAAFAVFFVMAAQVDSFSFIGAPSSSSSRAVVGSCSGQRQQQRYSFLVSSTVSATEDETAAEETTTTGGPGLVSFADMLSADGGAATATSTETTAEEPAAAAAGGEAPKKSINRERFTCFVGNLPFDATEEQIRDLFAPHSEVQLVTQPRNKQTGQTRGFAFVDVANDDEVLACVENLSETMVGGRPMRVVKSVPKEQLQKDPEYQEQQKARQATKAQRQENSDEEGYKKLYVGNIPFECSSDEMMELISPFTQEVREVYLPINDSGGGRGFAFVTVKDEDAQVVIDELDGTDFGGRRIVVNTPLPRGQKAVRGKSGNFNSRKAREDHTKLYVGNLSFYTVPETLKEIFEEFGEVSDVFLPPDNMTGESRGFGFVTMPNKDAAMEAIANLHECEIDGRIVRINEAEPRGTRASRDVEEKFDNLAEDSEDADGEGEGWSQ